MQEKITNMETAPLIPKAVEQIRKPEARSFYSDVLATTMKNYLGELFEHSEQGTIITELKKSTD